MNVFSIPAKLRLGTLSLMAIGCAGLLAPRPAAAQVSVLTHHYDNLRTGWNQNETALTYNAMLHPPAGQKFGLLQNVALDAQVDAQPLVVPNAVISGDPNPGSHDVVFVATEANTVYAIDPTRGTVLNSRNLGPAVPWPQFCFNNASTVGINGTPVIDPTTNSLYVIAYTNLSSPTYVLHRLALTDFSDVVTPQVVAASAPLGDGSKFQFNATYQRQRPALLLQNGAIYAGFGSFCDFAANLSRGWMLGWQASTLAPLQVNGQAGTVVSLLTDRQAQNPGNFFLSSLWMSGAGLAGDQYGNVFFVTGNSDPTANTYSRSQNFTNIEESAVKFNPTTNQVTSVFTPYDASSLDQGDVDFGAGGIVLLPNAVTGLPPRLAAAVGKDGWLFLMNRDSLGGYSGPNGPDKVVGRAQVGGCWCQPSYFELDGVPQIVSSGGSTLQLWAVGATDATLLPGISTHVTNPSNSGFFTSVSSHGAQNPIIWAVGRPGRGTTDIVLSAFAPQQGKTAGEMQRLFQGVVGTWPNTNALANLVPVVANGRVYVAGYQQLAIYGLGL
jgi:hypothetical protein